MYSTEYFKEKYDGTCSINNLKPNCITFVRDYKYLNKLKNCDFPLAVIAPNYMNLSKLDFIPDNVKFYFSSKDVDYEFTLIHNEFNEYRNKYEYYENFGVEIHPTVVIGVDGIKEIPTPDNKRIHFIHTGGVEIGDGTEIGAYTVIHRGTMDMTSIGKGVRIGVHCNIGHNNIIGENTVIAAGVMISGSVTIGKNCWLGTGSSFRQGITICDDVLIGVGSVVVSDIDTPGVYVGNPAKFLRKLTGSKGWDS